MRRPVTFNCFLRGLEGDVNKPFLKGWEVIKKNNSNLPKKIKHAKSDFEFARNAHNDQIDSAVKTTIEIYKLMKKECSEWLETHKFTDSSSSFDDAELLEHLEDRPSVRRTQSEYINYSPRGVKIKKGQSKKVFHTKLSDKLSRKKKH